jgi:hypothetical protein
MSHLLLCRLHRCGRVATLPAIKDVETETIPRNRAPIGRRNSPRAMQPLLRHDSHSSMPRQLHRSGRPATITGQHRVSPSPGRQHRNGRKYRLRTATQALDMPQFQCRNPSRPRRTQRARASQRTTNTRQLVQSKCEGEPEGSPDCFVPTSFSNADRLILGEHECIRLWKNSSGFDAAGLDHLIKTRKEYYVCRQRERTLKKGDRVAVLGRRIAVVKRKELP